MRYFPIFLHVAGRRVIVSGAGETAVAKLRLLLKTEARVMVFGADPDPVVAAWAREGRVTLVERAIEDGDALCAAMLYAANDDADEDARAALIGEEAGAVVNIVDNLADSRFITPAIVDRDPVVVAIGTEGAAPVLARRLKADAEERIGGAVGTLARIGQGYRGAVEALPKGRARRDFWSRWYDDVGPAALTAGGEEAAEAALSALLDEALRAERSPSSTARPGRVVFVSAGPGDPELLTLKARRVLHEADVVVVDRLVSRDVLELARREALIVDVGKTPGGASTPQATINALLVEHAREGAVVARLKSGDAGVFGRLDEELDTLEAAEIAYEIVPGVTAASAAAAEIGASMTRRGRNKAIRLITGHDMEGFAEQDWRGLAQPGAAAAIYMGVRAARFLTGRLLMHGADAQTPTTVVENASRPERRVVSASLAELPDRMVDAGISGPAILFIGVAARRATAEAPRLEAQAARSEGAVR